jgi:ankyrin repeat protein
MFGGLGMQGLLSLRILGVDDTADAPWGTVETGDFPPIHSAARMRDLATVLKELESRVDADLVCKRAKNGDGGNTALWYAAQGPWPGGIEVAKVLVDAGAEVNRQCEHGRTALHMAAAWGHLDLVKYLFESGADPSIRDELDMTPAKVARHGYRSNRVTDDERREVRLYFESLGFEQG